MFHAKYIILIAILLFNGIIIFAQNKIRYVSNNADKYAVKFEIKINEDNNKYCGNDHTINLNNMNLEVLNNDIIRSDAIREVSLAKNRLQKLPSNILDSIPNLTCLNISDNWINLYNSHMISISHYSLRMLDLSKQTLPNNKQVQVPSHYEIEDTEDAEDINKYKYIVFNCSGMSLPSLEHLYLTGNDISALCDDFHTSFPRLTHLFLNNIYAENVEPNFFNKIPDSLQVLHLENNHFRNISLKNLMNIKSLYLDGNTKLKSIEIISSNLRILSLSNSFNELGYVKLNIPYLEELDLTKNNFYTTSDIHFENYQTLKILLLDDNKLSEIPILTLQRLIELSLNYNMIRHVSSKRFVYLASLKKLSLRGNQIESIESDSFVSLRKLEYLDISTNNLKILPHDWLVPMISIQNLNLNYNHLTKISDLAITTNTSSYLKHLFVKDNIFSTISTLDLALLPPHITVYMA